MPKPPSKTPKKPERRRTRRREKSPSRLEWLKCCIIAIKLLRDLVHDLLDLLTG